MPSSAIAVAAKQAMPRQSAIRRATNDYVPSIDRNVSPTGRAVSMSLGACLTAFGLTGRRIEPFSLAAGVYLLYRGSTGNCLFTQVSDWARHGAEGEQTVIPAETGVRVEHAVTINRPANQVYGLWRDLSSLPRFMTHLKEVRETDHRHSHWVARGPMGMSVEWDAEIINDEPDEMLSWRSMPGADVDTAGSVHFRELPAGRGTEVRVNLKYDPPAGKIGSLVARLFGESPQRQIEADLSRFKSLLETGEVASTSGQPSGRR